LTLSAPPKPAAIPYGGIVAAYHEILPSLPRVRILDERRRRAIRARWREAPERQNMGWWREYFGAVARSRFLLGATGRGWRANLDWLLKPGKMAGVLEGQYDDRAAPGAAGAPPLRSPDEILRAAGLGPLRSEPDFVDTEVVGRD